MSKRFLAEFLGTFWLVFGGCGSAVLAARRFDAKDLIPYVVVQVIGAIVAAAVHYAVVRAWRRSPSGWR